MLQGVWAAFLVLPRTYDPATRAYGNLYSNLLDYVISAALIFYILTIAGVFRLRATRPDADRPYRAFGYPVVPALYIAGAATILLVLFIYERRRPGRAWSSCCSGCRCISSGSRHERLMRALSITLVRFVGDAVGGQFRRARTHCASAASEPHASGPLDRVRRDSR